MQLKDIMTRDPVVVRPEATLREVAQKMRELDSGVLPVGENDRLVGMVTDRDVTIRATAEGKDPNSTPVREILTKEVVYAFEDESLEEAAETMERHQLRRLLVLSRDKRLVGIVSLGDLAVHAPDNQLPGEVTEAVSEPARSEA